MEAPRVDVHRAWCQATTVAGLAASPRYLATRASSHAPSLGPMRALDDRGEGADTDQRGIRQCGAVRPRMAVSAASTLGSCPYRAPARGSLRRSVPVREVAARGTSAPRLRPCQSPSESRGSCRASRRREGSRRGEQSHWWSCHAGVYRGDEPRSTTFEHYRLCRRAGRFHQAHGRCSRQCPGGSDKMSTWHASR